MDLPIQFRRYCFDKSNRGYPYYPFKISCKIAHGRIAKFKGSFLDTESFFDQIFFGERHPQLQNVLVYGNTVAVFKRFFEGSFTGAKLPG